MSRSLYGLPNVKYVRMKWYGGASITLSSTSGVQTGTALLVNSPYDPWNSITGTFNECAAGYKLYSKLYRNICCVGAKLVVTISQSSVANGAYLPTAAFSSGTGSLGSYYSATLGTQPYKWGIKLDEAGTIDAAKWTIIASCANQKNSIFRPNLAGTARKKLSITYSARKFWGIKDPSDDLASLACIDGSNPSKVCYAIPWVQSYDCSSTAVGNVYLTYALYMTCRCSDKFELNTKLASADELMQS